MRMILKLFFLVIFLTGGISQTSVACESDFTDDRATKCPTSKRGEKHPAATVQIGMPEDYRNPELRGSDIPKGEAQAFRHLQKGVQENLHLFLHAIYHGMISWNRTLLVEAADRNDDGFIDIIRVFGHPKDWVFMGHSLGYDGEVIISAAWPTYTGSEFVPGLAWDDGLSDLESLTWLHMAPGSHSPELHEILHRTADSE